MCRFLHFARGRVFWAGDASGRRSIERSSRGRLWWVKSCSAIGNSQLNRIERELMRKKMGTCPEWGWMIRYAIESSLDDGRRRDDRRRRRCHWWIAASWRRWMRTADEEEKERNERRKKKWNADPGKIFASKQIEHLHFVSTLCPFFALSPPPLTLWAFMDEQMKWVLIAMGFKLKLIQRKDSLRTTFFSKHYFMESASVSFSNHYPIIQFSRKFTIHFIRIRRTTALQA